MNNRRRKILGVGVNNLDYTVIVTETVGYIDGKQIQKKLWQCPYYTRWLQMLTRCYSKRLHKELPRYEPCTVCEDWLLLSNFKSWMEQQDWEGNHLDKDLLVRGNNVYSPDTCCFIPEKLNIFLVECNARRGDWPIGVSWKPDKNKFRARCNNPFTRKEEHLGYFEDARLAHKAWLARKLELSHEFATIIHDQRIMSGLILRYEEYNKSEK